MQLCAVGEDDFIAPFQLHINFSRGLLNNAFKLERLTTRRRQKNLVTLVRLRHCLLYTSTEQPEERPAPWPQLPDGVEVNEWMRSLKRHERRALMRSLRDKQAKNLALIHI